GNRRLQPTWPNHLSATIGTVRASKRGRTACGFRPVHLELFRVRDEVPPALCEFHSTLAAGSYRLLLPPLKIGAAAKPKREARRLNARSASAIARSLNERWGCSRRRSEWSRWPYG